MIIEMDIIKNLKKESFM
jgi:hypothetical protein